MRVPGTVIMQGTLHACSDGSVDKGIGSHAWVFAHSDGTILLQGAGPDDGNPVTMSSYRLEAGDFVAVLFLLSCVIKNNAIGKGRTRVYCDQKNTLEKIFTDVLPIYPLLEADYDLLGIARSLVSAVHIYLIPEWALYWSK